MLTLIRIQYTSDGIYGRLCEGDSQWAVTLEHAYDQGDGTYAPKIPVGTYTCVRRHSPHFGYDLFWLTNVPGHDWIEIHRGNYNKDSDGCILLGRMIEPGMIVDSKATFEDFMERLQGINSFVLEVR